MDFARDCQSPIHTHTHPNTHTHARYPYGIMGKNFFYFHPHFLPFFKLSYENMPFDSKITRTCSEFWFSVHLCANGKYSITEEFNIGFFRVCVCSGCYRKSSLHKDICFSFRPKNCPPGCDALGGRGRGRWVGEAGEGEEGGHSYWELQASRHHPLLFVVL